MLSDISQMQITFETSMNLSVCESAQGSACKHVSPRISKLSGVAATLCIMSPLVVVAPNCYTNMAVLSIYSPSFGAC